MNSDGVIQAYLSISKQYGFNRLDCIGEIERLFAKHGIEVDVNHFKGGGYTSPKDIIGDIDFFFTFVPNYGQRVGKGVVSEYNYAIEQGAICLCIDEEGSFTTISRMSHAKPQDWTEYALIQPNKMVVMRHANESNLVTFDTLLSNKGFIPPPKVNPEYSNHQLLMV